MPIIWSGKSLDSESKWHECFRKRKQRANSYDHTRSQGFVPDVPQQSAKRTYWAVSEPTVANHVTISNFEG